MTPKEASRKAWAEMKQKPFKERLAYFWDYYKWHTLAVLALVIVTSLDKGTQPFVVCDG